MSGLNQRLLTDFPSLQRVPTNVQLAATLRLPWPPSLNNYYEPDWSRRKIRLTACAYNYREDVINMWRGLGFAGFGAAPLQMEIRLYPPDGDTYDVDNMLKAPLDALRRAGAYDDDSQIDPLIIRRGRIDPRGGLLAITISPRQ